MNKIFDAFAEQGSMFDAPISGYLEVPCPHSRRVRFFDRLRRREHPPYHLEPLIRMSLEDGPNMTLEWDERGVMTVRDDS